MRDADGARAAALAAGARLTAARRLQDDAHFDTPDQKFLAAGCTLRLRREHGHAMLTFKGAVERGVLKSRPETQTRADDADALASILGELGLGPTFRSQKYREEYHLSGTTLAIDETPIGTFFEIEGPPVAIPIAAAALGHSPDDFIVESYWRLHATWCADRGVTATHMLFDPPVR